MADRANFDEYRADIWIPTIDGDLLEHHASIEIPDFPYGLVDIKSGRTGGDVHGKMVWRRTFDFKFTLYQATELQFARYLEMDDIVAPVYPLAVGRQLPKHTLSLHDPQAPDALGDFHILAATFNSIAPTPGNSEQKQITVSCTATIDAATGESIRRGPDA